MDGGRREKSRDGTYVDYRDTGGHPGAGAEAAHAVACLELVR